MRADFLKTVTPHLWVEYTLYPTSKGGKTKDVSMGWGCPCFVEKDPMSGGCDAYPILKDKVMSPSESRYLGLWFMNPVEAKPHFEKAGHFWLWEGGFIGEATVKPNYAGMTGNERLFEAGLFDQYDLAVKKDDRDAIAKIMQRIFPP